MAPHQTSPTVLLLLLSAAVFLTDISQIPPDFVVKTQGINIVEIISSLLRRADVVQTSWRNRTSRCELLAPSEAHWSTIKSDGIVHEDVRLHPIA